uniref:Uncharacterized protein n=1 Tax=Kalanchoe fedtschenkoi TaxID=63787 RepID=A0A7N0T9X0_KALFE
MKVLAAVGFEKNPRETMAKSLRCKREKRLRAIKREMVVPHYEKKEAAKLAAQEAALAAPKLPVRQKPSDNAMDLASSSAAAVDNTMDMEMGDAAQADQSLKPVGGIGKKRKFKVGKSKRRGCSSAGVEGQ